MSDIQDNPVEKLESQLELAQRELLEYARDLRKLVALEREKTQLLEQAHYTSLRRLANICELRDSGTGEHIKRISRFVFAIAKGMDLEDKQAKIFADASCLHDLGKIAVPDKIMLKEGPLDESEWQVMRRHPVFGASLLEGDNSPLMQEARRIALTHHEKWDGTGYPYGIKGNEIPLSGRMTMLADVYDALRSDRPYKRGFTHEETCDIILNGDGRTNPQDFDPQILELFETIHPQLEEVFDDKPEPVVAPTLSIM